jgi:hypothetical protein
MEIGSKRISYITKSALLISFPNAYLSPVQKVVVLSAASVSRQIRTRRIHSHGMVLANVDGRERR